METYSAKWSSYKLKRFWEQCIWGYNRGPILTGYNTFHQRFVWGVKWRWRKILCADTLGYQDEKDREQRKFRDYLDFQFSVQWPCWKSKVGPSSIFPHPSNGRSWQLGIWGCESRCVQGWIRSNISSLRYSRVKTFWEHGPTGSSSRKTLVSCRWLAYTIRCASLSDPDSFWRSVCNFL